MNRSAVPICLVLATLLVLPAATHPAHASELLAHYPMQVDALDATGHWDPITLENAPFQRDGVYCNGIYPDDPGGCLIQTPWIWDLDFESCAISMEFMLQPSPTSRRPIFVCGQGSRWMGVEHESDRTITLYYNNGMSVTSDVVITPDTWHRAFIAYDGAIDTGTLYLDDELVVSVEFESNHGNDSKVSTSNFGAGATFDGHVRDLRIYDSAFTPTPVQGSTWGQVKATFR